MLFNSMKIGELKVGDEKWQSLLVDGKPSQSMVIAEGMWDEFMKQNPTFVPAPPGRDYTAERNERCKPVVEKILKLMLEKDLLLSDFDYVNEMVKQQLEAAFKHIVHAHAHEIFTIMKKSLMESVGKAQEFFWDKDPGDVSVGDLEKTLQNRRVRNKERKDAAVDSEQK